MAGARIGGFGNRRGLLPVLVRQHLTLSGAAAARASPCRFDMMDQDFLENVAKSGLRETAFCLSKVYIYTHTCTHTHTHQHVMQEYNMYHACALHERIMSILWSRGRHGSSPWTTALKGIHAEGLVPGRGQSDLNDNVALSRDAAGPLRCVQALQG